MNEKRHRFLPGRRLALVACLALLLTIPAVYALSPSPEPTDLPVQAGAPLWERLMDSFRPPEGGDPVWADWYGGSYLNDQNGLTVVLVESLDTPQLRRQILDTVASTPEEQQLVRFQTGSHSMATLEEQMDRVLSSDVIRDVLVSCSIDEFENRLDLTVLENSAAVQQELDRLDPQGTLLAVTVDPEGAEILEDEKPAPATFLGTVLEIRGSTLLVEVAEDAAGLRTGDQVTFSWAHTDILSPGDSIRVTFSGGIMETWPAQLGDVSALTPVFADVVPGSWYAEAVDFLSGQGLLAGTGGSTFDPEGRVTCAMVSTLLWRLEGSPREETPPEETGGDSWYGDALAWATSRKVLPLPGELDLQPEETVTREQLALLLYRYDDSRKTAGTGSSLESFQDAPEIQPDARDAMDWAAGAGLLQGTDSTHLSPRGEVTRAQVATLLARYLRQDAAA